MALDDIAEKLKTRMGGFNHTAKFDFDEDGIPYPVCGVCGCMVREVNDEGICASCVAALDEAHA